MSLGKLYSQTTISSGSIHGNFSFEGQLYKPDDKIGADSVDEKFLSNSFLNLIYNNGPFTVGVRYEAYLNPMLGYDQEYKGNGVPYRFATYQKDELEVTVGNFYDQFGNGLIFRSYEEKTLGIDNSIDGIRVKYSPIKGLTIKGLAGNQRYYWAKSKGLLRGFDGEAVLNDIFSSLANCKTKITLGGSFISKYQAENPTAKFKSPENVGAYAGRMDISRGNFGLSGEYAYKINDPSALNNQIYKPGEALFVTATYSKKGLGVILAAKRIDNMNFRTDRSITGNPLTISYIPTLTRQHSYALASIYPYASQANGEIGYFAQVEYLFKKGTFLGGKYGTDVAVNFSKVNALDKKAINDTTLIGESGTKGYKSDFFSFGKTVFFHDFNVEITHKFNKKWKAIFSYMNQSYNLDVIEGHPGEPMVYADIAIADITYKFNEKHALRCEFQGLMTKQDKGDWAAIVAEYTFAPKWFVSVMDLYNYGNDESEKQLHYYLGSVGYTKGPTRIAFSYGRQREGIICVGGVCRQVPASNGLQISVTSSF